MRASSLSMVCLASCLAVVPLSARAQGKGAAAPAALSPQDEANARFQTGLKYYDARDFESARLAFAQAYAVLKRPSILLNLALSELYSGKPLEALGHLDTFLAETDLPADKRARATKAREEAYAKTGHLRIKAAKGAEVTLDGEPLAVVADVVHVAAGEHTVTASAAGVTQTKKVVATAGVETPVDVMGPEASVPPPVGESPRTENAHSFWGWRSAAGFAAVGVGAGLLVYGVVAEGQHDDATARAAALRGSQPADACRGSSDPGCASLRATVEDGDSARVRSQIAFGVGAGLVVGGAVLIASAVKWPHDKFVSVGVLSGPKLMGLSMSGSF